MKYFWMHEENIRDSNSVVFKYFKHFHSYKWVENMFVKRFAKKKYFLFIMKTKFEIGLGFKEGRQFGFLIPISLKYLLFCFVSCISFGFW